MMSKWAPIFYTSLLFLVTSSCSSPTEKITVNQKPTAISIDVKETGTSTPIPIPDKPIFQDTLDRKIPVIFVHGGGPCDIGAMVYLAKHPNIDLIGLVLSFGEFHPINAMDKWPVFLYDVLHYDTAALGLGSETALDPNGHEFPAAWRSLSDDFWGLDVPVSKRSYQSTVGYQLIIDLVKNSPQKVTILIMSAMTDLAHAFKQDPSIADNIANIVIMGGAFTMRGNLDEGPEETRNEAAEWNMYVDPQAAKIVMHSGAPISIVPLDAIQYYVQQKDMETINAIDDPGVRYIAQMWEKQWGWSGNQGFFIWDTLTSVAITNPNFFDWVYDGVDVITEVGDFQGQTIPLKNGAKHIRYAVAADYAAILNQLFTICRSDSTNVAFDALITELAGTWEGSTDNFHISFTLGDACKLNEKCGSFLIPEFTLTGDVTIVNILGNIYEFKVTNTSSGQPGNAYEYLQLLQDGTIKYHTESSQEINEAILYKKP